MGLMVKPYGLMLSNDQKVVEILILLLYGDELLYNRISKYVEFWKR
jgi:hypothetical protein